MISISFSNIKQWMVEVDEFSSDTSLPRILVGNKADLVDRREVEYKTAAEFASQKNIAYIETSVIGRSNIKVQNIIQLSSSYNSIYFRRHS